MTQKHENLIQNNCDIVRDLMPLAAEELASPGSSQMVEEHLTACPECKREWELILSQSAPVPQEALPLVKVSRGIRKKRWLWALMLVSFALALAMSFTAFMTDKQYVPYEEGLLEIRQEGQVLQVQANQPGMYVDVSLETFADADKVIIADISVYTRRLDGGGSNTVQQSLASIPEGSAVSAWYLEPGRANRFLYGKNPLSDGGVISLPRLALVYYLRAALVLFAGVLVLLTIFRKMPRMRIFLAILLGLPLAYVGGHLLVKGFSTLSWYSLGRDLAWISVCGLFLYLAWLFFLPLVRMKYWS